MFIENLKINHLMPWIKSQQENKPKVGKREIESLGDTRTDEPETIPPQRYGFEEEK